MILSASRRTDIPNYYSDWFFNRIREGFVYVRNPMNFHQVSKIGLSPELIDCIVFWTKNPQPMLARLGELSAYPYYFQFTLTGYGKDIEPGVPYKKDRMIAVFQELSEKLGNSRVIWRYDPILFNAVYTKEYHLNAFGQIAEGLKGYADKCVISYVDTYAKNQKRMRELAVREPDEEEIRAFSGELARIAQGAEMEISTCAEKLDLSDCGIAHSHCVDKALIESITGCPLKVGKDRNQRAECGCVESIDIGCYDTCRNGCKYCYASRSDAVILKNCRNYNAASPLLCSELMPEDRVTERKLCH
ncbi:MAG: DUF1848 domain-containing protein [Lachnospiraceae bacterium]|nr:DUF1848 domain-containing protein [Lachnospiraceae bacterium]